MLQGCHTRMPFSQVSRGFCCNCELLAITLANIGDNSREWMASRPSPAFARSDRHFRIGVGAPAKLQMTEETAAMLALKKAIP
jgi:hypothetical protein